MVGRWRRRRIVQESVDHFMRAVQVLLDGRRPMDIRREQALEAVPAPPLDSVEDIADRWNLFRHDLAGCYLRHRAPSSASPPAPPPTRASAGARTPPESTPSRRWCSGTPHRSRGVGARVQRSGAGDLPPRRRGRGQGQRWPQLLGHGQAAATHPPAPPLPPPPRMGRGSVKIASTVQEGERMPASRSWSSQATPPA
jgi:hypothetical protein